MRRISFGTVSLIAGCAALGCFLWLAYLLRFTVPFGGYVLNFLDVVGLVNTGPSYIAELKPASIFSMNDSNAIVWLHWCAFSLGAVAGCFALLSERKREANAYAGAGFILGTIGIWLIAPVVGLVSQAIGAILLLLIRRSDAVEV